MSRIIAGRLASRHISTPTGSQTRPTTDRVRESVFAQIAAWLGTADRAPQEQLAGLAFLDLYAGSGAVGLEAASRGARPTWVEKDRSTARLIDQNRRRLDVQGRVQAMDVTSYLTRSPAGAGFDLVWLDPPYAVPTAVVDQVIALVADRGWLKPDGWTVVERSCRTSAIEFPESFLNVGDRRYGDTVIYYAEGSGDESGHAGVL